MVDRHRDALAARLGHQLGRLLDRLGAVDLGAALARGAPGGVDGSPRLAERHRDPAAAAARSPAHQGDLACQRPTHAGVVPIASRGR
jgi:hypothetical protein